MLRINGGGISVQKIEGWVEKLSLAREWSMVRKTGTA